MDFAGRSHPGTLPSVRFFPTPPPRRAQGKTTKKSSAEVGRRTAPVRPSSCKGYLIASLKPHRSSIGGQDGRTATGNKGVIDRQCATGRLPHVNGPDELGRQIVLNPAWAPPVHSCMKWAGSGDEPRMGRQGENPSATASSVLLSKECSRRSDAAPLVYVKFFCAKLRLCGKDARQAPRTIECWSTPKAPTPLPPRHAPFHSTTPVFSKARREK